MLSLKKQLSERENLFAKLSWAGIFSAKENGKGADIHLTDYQINYLREILKKEVLK